MSYEVTPDVTKCQEPTGKRNTQDSFVKLLAIPEERIRNSGNVLERCFAK
jgi:hypothetical protein